MSTAKRRKPLVMYGVLLLKSTVIAWTWERSMAEAILAERRKTNPHIAKWYRIHRFVETSP